MDMDPVELWKSLNTKYAKTALILLSGLRHHDLLAGCVAFPHKVILFRCICSSGLEGTFVEWMTYCRTRLAG